MKKVLYISLWALTVSGCKKLYEPNIDSPSNGYLVVEGFINSGGGVSTVTLSRTTRIKDSVSVIYEHHAQVSIESSNNESFPLSEGVNGSYSSDTLQLNPNAEYRVRIITERSKEYVSDFSAVKYTPIIDSLNWDVEHNGVQIYVNTHDDQNNTRYYRWTYSETWEFHSRFLQTVFYIIDPVSHLAIDVAGGGAADTTIYKCWRTQNSTSIILGSSENLTGDRIHLPVRSIAPQADELTVLYYIRLKQFSLSHQAYLFYQNLRKNTEQLGTIFDPMPSEISGNIRCVNDPGEIVIGYIETSQEQEKDLFIRNSDLPMIWLSQMSCTEFKVDNKPPLSQAFIPTRIAEMGPYNTIASFYAADPLCVDCTLRGTNKRPAFWP